MKLSWGFIASSLYCSAAATKDVAVGPEAARLIFAQRLGLSRYHSVEHVGADTIRHINAFGGRRQELFGAADVSRSRAHLLMWVEEEGRKEATVTLLNGQEDEQSFTIKNVPAPSENERLLEDFALQADSLPKRADPQQRTYSTAMDIEDALPQKGRRQTHNDYLCIYHATKSDAITADMLASSLAKLQKNIKANDLLITIIKVSASPSHSKRTANPWGTYDVPSKIQARSENAEALISIDSAPSSSAAPAYSDLEDFPHIAQAGADADAAAVLPVRGILPKCFTSLSACEKTTRNCTGHGSCALLHKGQGSGSNRESIDCYGCACVPTVAYVGKDKGDKKVTYWGGPACQKKDISIQFWLFVGSGVVLAGLVAAAIGMLYSMGSEELPSVIGAGVSGPVRK